MTRILAVVEGQTEEAFIGSIVAPAFWNRNICVSAIVLGRPGHKGGRVNYARMSHDVLMLLKQQHDAYCTTMVDLYRLGPGFPGTPPPNHLSNLEKVRHIEAAFKKDICDRIPQLRPDLRFIPYLQLHEYEGLLFSDPQRFASGINRSSLASHFQKIRDQFETPEDINDDPETAPSKRILTLYPPYRKVIEGAQAASSIGLPALRAACPHFREWLELLEAVEEL